jgi:uncharacterized delta-60 repeat protein
MKVGRFFRVLVLVMIAIFAFTGTWLISTPGSAWAVQAVKAWQQTYDNGGDDQPVAVKVDTAGNVLMTGYSEGNGTNYDIVTIKYSKSDTQQGSKVLWKVRYDGPAHNEDKPTAMALDKNNNVIVTGYSVAANGKYDFITIKYDANGKTKWTSRYNGTGNDDDQAVAAAVDNAGDVYVTGWSWSKTRIGYVTIKYSGLTGKPVWTKRYDGTGPKGDFPVALAVGSNGVYVTGESSNSTDYDYLTIKYAAADGKLVWKKTYNNPEANEPDDVPTAITLDRAGNVIVTGQAENANVGWDFVTIKYSAQTGNCMWSGASHATGAGGGYAKPVAVMVDPSNNIFVAGVLLNKSQNYDFGLIKLDGKTGNMLWGLSHDEAQNWDEPTAMEMDASGNVYITGFSYKTSSAGYDYLTLKYDNDGYRKWSARYNGADSNEDRAVAIALDKWGKQPGVVVTGHSYASGQYNNIVTIRYKQQ